MKNLKRILVVALVLVYALTLCACGSNKKAKDDSTVKIGVVGEAQEMWVPVKEKLAKEGINIELVTFSDYATPNAALNNGEVDLNAFQHHAFLDAEIKAKKYDITSIFDTFIASMSIYSDKYKDISEVKDGDKVAVPSDPSNECRALKVLQAAKLIELDKAAGNNPEVKDIVSNPKNLKLVEVEAANVCAMIPDVGIVVTNGQYAIDHGFDPSKDPVFKDSIDNYNENTYSNLIAARTKDKDNPVFQKIIEAYKCDEVKKVFSDTYKGSYIPAWK